MPELATQRSLSRLEQLPLELQEHILRFAVVESEFIGIETYGDVFPDFAIPPVTPSVAQVNRSLRKQALPMYYGENIFMLKDQPGILYDQALPSLRPWFEVFERFANGSARVGISGPYGWFSKSVQGLDIILSIQVGKRQGLSYKYTMGNVHKDWPAENLELMAKSLKSGGKVMLEQLYMACSVDLREASWYSQGEADESEDESDDEIVCPVGFD